MSVPIYEYKCTECGHRMEVLQKLSDSPLTTCVKCEGKVERLVSSPAIQFKGSGWYVTDYARKGKTSAESSEKPSCTESTPEKSRAKGSGPAPSASSTTKD